jgi:hypothetical protein
LAGVVFDDHFEGNSGSTPSGWSGDGQGTVIESGTTLAFQGNFVIWTNDDLDPNEQNATIITTSIDGTTDHVHVGFLDFAQFDNHIWIKLHALDGKIEVKASNVQGGEEEYVAGYVDGYNGGATHLTVLLEPDSFTIETDTPPFAAGPIPYASVFTTFTRADLGDAARLVIENECSGTGSCTSSYDRITVTVEEASAVDVVSHGRVKALYRR